MAPRQYWIGSFGPFSYNDADLFQDASPHRFATDRPPIANDDVVRLQDLNANIQLVASANIDNPAAELAGLSSTVNGGLLIVYQAVGAVNDEYTIYAWDSNPGAADVPYAVTGNGGMWVAVAGKYHNGEASFGDSTNNLAISTNGILTLAGTARVTDSLPIDITTPRRPVVNPPGQGTENGFPTLDYDDTIEESILLEFHLPHGYASSGLVHLHLDFFVDTAPVGAANAGWGVEYKKVSEGDIFDFTIGTTILEAATAITTGTPANDKRIHEAQGLIFTTAGWASDDTIYCRLYRNVTVGSDFTGDIRMIGKMHVEYLRDRLGD